MTIEQYNLYKDFLNEINENIQLIRNLIRVEINIKLFSNINFLLILLFDKNQNSSLSKFIEEFTFEDKVVLTNISMPPVSERFKLSSNSFKTTRKPIDDDEQSSQYSTLSSILGFQVSFSFQIKFNLNLKFYLLSSLKIQFVMLISILKLIQLEAILINCELHLEMSLIENFYLL